METLLRIGVGKLKLQRKNLLMNSIRLMDKDRWKKFIGDREVVGPGINGNPIYLDCTMFPFPAIRFQRNSPYIQALREKEKCDWRNLTNEEKKCLYRASFCQTFAEMNAPTGEWKSIIGWLLFYCSLSMWLYIAMEKLFLDELPESVRNPEFVRANIKYAVDAEMEHIDGISSKYDYENDRWKPGYKNRFYDPEDDDELD